MSSSLTFDQLMLQAKDHPLEGWDFRWLGHRLREEPLPWRFDEIVSARSRKSSNLLDMGTGGGEWLRGLDWRSVFTVATEGWGPNVALAGRTLKPLGISVVYVEGAPDNADQQRGETRGVLPFRSGAFHLISNRHEAFLASEVARVLAGGGVFLTQQVAEGFNRDFYSILGIAMPSSSRPAWDLELAEAQVRSAGFDVVASGKGETVLSFADVGAFSWYLLNLPWVVPGFAIDSFRERMKVLHDGKSTLVVRQPHFWLEAVKVVDH